MKVLTLVGTRPELIRLSIIIEKLDKLVDHVFVYTNQNYDPNLSTIFFEELNIRKPDYYFKDEVSGIGSFLSKAFSEFEYVLDVEKPDKVLVLGDTNSGLLAMLVAKQGIPVYHMEAGNRCFDGRVPEETNRRIIDSFSKYNLPYTENSKQNLLNEGYHKNSVFKTGNPIYEVLTRFNTEIYHSTALDAFGLEKQNYVLVTVHRAENVDDDVILKNIMSALNYIAADYKVIFSVHPRTKNKLNKFKIVIDDNILISEPFGFFDFVKLEQNAFCIITDSGTVSEESSLLGVPSIIIRESTERQELIECGSAILTGTETSTIITAFQTVDKMSMGWCPPQDYLVKNVSDIVINILLGGGL